MDPENDKEDANNKNADSKDLAPTEEVTATGGTSSQPENAVNNTSGADITQSIKAPPKHSTTQSVEKDPGQSITQPAEGTSGQPENAVNNTSGADLTQSIEAPPRHSTTQSVEKDPGQSITQPSNADITQPIASVHFVTNNSEMLSEAVNCEPWAVAVNSSPPIVTVKHLKYREVWDDFAPPVEKDRAKTINTKGHSDMESSANISHISTLKKKFKSTIKLGGSSMDAGEAVLSDEKLSRSKTVKVEIPKVRRAELWDLILPQDPEPKERVRNTIMFAKNVLSSKESLSPVAPKKRPALPSSIPSHSVPDSEIGGKPAKNLKQKAIKKAFINRTASRSYQKFFFSYMNPLLAALSKEDIPQNLFPPIDININCKPLADSFLAMWYLEQAANKDEAKILRVIYQKYKNDIFYTGIPYFLESLLKIGQGYSLGMLLEWFSLHQVGNDKGLKTGLIWGGILSALVLLHAAISQLKFFYTIRLGMRFRVTIMAALFAKSIKLPGNSFGPGQICSILTNDLQRFEECAQHIHYLWVGIIETAIVSYFLYQKIGYSGLIAVAVLILLVPLQLSVSSAYIRLRRKTNISRDERIKSLSDMIQGMLIVKLFAWEDAFVKRISEIRAQEVKDIRRSSLRRAINEALYFASGTLISTVAFSIYYVTQILGTKNSHLWTPSIIFTSSMYLAIVRSTMANNFFRAYQFSLESLLAIERIQKVFEADEVHLINSNDMEELKNNNVLIALREATFSFGRIKNANGHMAENICIKNITLTIRKGELIGICGPIGSGKSALIQAILGEAHCIGGKMGSNSRNIALVSQNPWIIAGTFRENILFGKPFKSEWFDEVVKACALDVDFALLPDMERSKIDERGSNLSGGQRVRLALARAVYSNADIYLLDDPLSALDSKVAKHIFQNCICTVLKNKAVLLISHLITFIQQCDSVILLEGGKISTAGTFQSVTDTKGSHFASAISAQPIAGNATKLLTKEMLSGELFRLSATKRKSALKDSLVLADHLIEVENQGVGKISLEMYWRYFTAGSHPIAIFGLFLLLVSAQLAAGFSDWWLSYWMDSPNPYALYYIYVYAGLGILALSLGILRAIWFFFNLLTSSQVLFMKMLKSIFHVPASFLQKTPAGRITNRLSKDIHDLDEIIPQAFFDFVQRSFMMFGMIIISIIIIPWILILYPILLLSFYYYQTIYINAARRMKRLESASRSPIYTSVQVANEGKTIIRAFQVKTRFYDRFCHLVNENSRIYFSLINSARWLGVRIDLISALFVAAVVILSIMFQNYLRLTSSQIGLIIFYLLQFVGLVQITVRLFGEVGNLMVSTERVMDYAHGLPQESTAGSTDLPDDWPERGEVIFKDFSLQYPGEKNYTIRDFSAKMPSFSKTAIIGRTGAGKSSLIQALFRTYEPTNNQSITIDGINICNLKLSELRNRLAVIPQEPICFKGTLRFNLDPYGLYPDEYLWSTLESVNLKKSVQASPAGLDMEVTESGGNISIGERQLLSMARALLKNSRLLIMDEATSSVDIEADKLIREIISEIHNTTIISVAHRLPTIIEYDQILVLNRGILVEQGRPHELIEKDPEDANAWLVNMVNQLAPDEIIHLKRMIKLLKRKSLKQFHT